MADRENREILIVDILKEIIPDNAEDNWEYESSMDLSAEEFDKLVDSEDVNLRNKLRKGYRYYKAYKNMECMLDIINGADLRVYAEDKDMITRNLKKILENPEYKKFINEANKLDFTFQKFLELIKEDKNREIFEDLYLNGLYELDTDFYNITKEDIDTYIEKVDYNESIERSIHLIKDLELLVGVIFTMKDKVNRAMIMKDLEKSMKKNSIKVMDYLNRENYLNRIASVMPEFRLVTRIEDLPTELFNQYIKYNGFETLGEITYDENGFPKDNITDERIVEISERYYGMVEEENEKHKKEVEETSEEIERRLKLGFNIKKI